MVKVRIIPCLQLLEGSLVKTVKFKNPAYIGDPVNTVRIFNELEVDELCFLDIRSSLNGHLPDMDLLAQIAGECFMPLSYGGGINDLETAKQIFSLGYEKIIVNSAAFSKPGLIEKFAEHFGSQSVVGSIDVKRSFLGSYAVYSHSGTRKTSYTPVEWAQLLEKKGVGELLITSIDREGTWKGYDESLMKAIVAAVDIPVIANGGAGNLGHLKTVIKHTDVSAVALGSMVVYQKQDMGVLINYPDITSIESVLG